MSYNLGRHTWDSVVSNVKVIKKNSFGPTEFFCKLSIFNETKYCKLMQNKSKMEDLIFVNIIRKKTLLKSVDYNIIYIKNNSKTTTKTHVCYIVIPIEFKNDKYIDCIKLGKEFNESCLKEIIDNILINFILFYENNLNNFYTRMTYISIEDMSLLPFYYSNKKIVNVTNKDVRIIKLIKGNEKLVKDRLTNILNNFNIDNINFGLSVVKKVSITATKTYYKKVYNRIETLESSPFKDLLGYII